jgi:hypothetical protein
MNFLLIDNQINDHKKIIIKMKRHFLLFLPLLVLAIGLFTGFSGDDPEYPTGAPAGYTGSPGDGKNCTQCHGGSPSTVSGWITSDIPPEGYTPGNTYTITVTVTGGSRKGFEVSPQNPAGALLGTLTAGTGNKLVGSNKYVTQNAGSYNNPAVWTFTWTAPAAGTGLVTFWGAFCASEPVTKLSTLDANELVPFSVLATATPSTLCNGQTSQLGATPLGGSGTVYFSWTSIPPGFTSTSQNPVVQPAQSTQYVVQAINGTITAYDTVDVAVNQPPMAAAGSDTTCYDTVSRIPLHGNASNYSAILWTTSGDGTFSNASGLNGYYYPGTGDKTSGSVTITLTASPLTPCANPEASARTIQFLPYTGIRANGKLLTVFIGPNPSNGIVTVSIPEITNMQATITVTDLEGKIIYYETRTSPPQGLSVTMDLSTFPKGIYLVKVRAESRFSAAKLILQ